MFWKHNTFLAVYCTLVTVPFKYIFKNKTEKTAKQISKQDKTKKKKKRKKGKRRFLAGFEPGTFGYTRPHIATTPLRKIGESSQI